MTLKSSFANDTSHTLFIGANIFNIKVHTQKYDFIQNISNRPIYGATYVCMFCGRPHMTVSMERG